MNTPPVLYKDIVDESLPYRNFLTILKNNDYEFVSFAGLNAATRQIVIRHDIDFDCELAYKMALIENEMGIQTSYFFLASSQSYNIASERDQSYVNRIRELGHTISLHFDPVMHSSDFIKGFLAEVHFFESLFNVKVEIISLHRPNDFFRNSNQPIGGIQHTYQKKYFKDVKYFADSTAVWRFGHPFNSEEFAKKKSLHILIHPIWWLIDGATNTAKLKNHFIKMQQSMKDHYLVNCKPFKEIYDEI